MRISFSIFALLCIGQFGMAGDPVRIPIPDKLPAPSIERRLDEKDSKYALVTLRGQRH
jgi:hypothetical protein